MLIPFKNIPVYKIILWGIFLISALQGVLLILYPAAIFPDPSWGFQVMRSMQMGGGFNTLITPDHKDVAKNTSEFLTWWSPGQYLVPLLFKNTLNVNTGQATAITTAVCQLTGLAGLFVFFKKAGFTPLVCVFSLITIMCQQAYFSPYIFYNGGEVLLFAFTGWFLYGCMKTDKPGVKMVLFVLLSGWIGFICKSSFIWMYAAGLLFIWIRLCYHIRNIKEWLINGLWTGIPAITALACIYIFYLSKGNNPSSYSNGLKLTWETVAFPLASPLLSGFSFDDMANGLIYHNDAVIFNYTWSVLILLLLALLSVALIWSVWEYVPHHSYKTMLVSFYLVSVVFFSYVYFRQLPISYEARHFRIIGLLIIPGIICLFQRFKWPIKITLVLLTMVTLSFGLKFYINGYKWLKNEGARGVSGIAQQFIDQPSINYLAELDKKNRNALFVSTSADIGLDIMHNRIITLEPLGPDIVIDDEQYLYKGHAGPLYIFLPSNYIGIRASVVLKCFPGYKGFTLKELSDDYVLYYSNSYR